MLGAVLLVAHLVDTYWMVMPALVPFTVWTSLASIALLVVVVVIAMVMATAYASRATIHATHKRRPVQSLLKQLTGDERRH
jgi:hypothetical protein